MGVIIKPSVVGPGGWVKRQFHPFTDRHPRHCFVRLQIKQKVDLFKNSLEPQNSLKCYFNCALQVSKLIGCDPETFSILNAGLDLDHSSSKATVEESNTYLRTMVNVLRRLLHSSVSFAALFL